MKSLQESLFDNDLVSKELPLIKMVKKLSRDNVSKLSRDDIREILNELCNSGEKCDKQSLLKHKPVDLSKNVIINIDQFMDNIEAPINCHYFLYKSNNKYLLSYMRQFNGRTERGWRWATDSWSFLDIDDWKEQARIITNMFFNKAPIFVILDEKISKLLIKAIGY